MANTVDADFLALPLSALSDAAIDAAKAAGASHVDVRIERTRTGYLSLRDAKPETQSDESNLGIGVRVIVDGAWGFASSPDLSNDTAKKLALSAVAPGPLTAELSAEMGTIADIESRGGATVYRFSEASIRRGLDHGKTGEQIKTFLTKTSKTPMPQPLDYLIADVAKRHGRLRVGSAHTYIRCEDEGLVQQILHDKKCEHLRLRKIASQVLVTELELPEVISELREYGYLPAAENASGVLLSQPNLRRAKSRPKPPRIISEFTAPKASVVLAAVKTIRAGERSRKVEPIVAGTSSNETLALINQYIDEQRTLVISYADNNGGVSNRIIEPISISLGTLTARDETTGEITQFRIPRINGVAPSLTILENKADLDL